MKLTSTLFIALRALQRNKMRSGLTALGIIIGVGAVIAMISIGNGARAQVQAQIASLGENVILIFSGSTTSSGIHTGWGGAGTLKVEDADAVSREIVGVVAISPGTRAVMQVVAGNQNWFTIVQGESHQYFDIRQWPFLQGTSFTEQDIRSANKVAVIGKTIAHQLYGDASRALGATLRIKNVPFTVVGILQPKGLSLMGTDQDDTIILPYTSAMKRVVGTTSLRSITVQVSEGTDLKIAQQQITALLRERHKIGPGKDDDFMVRNQEEIAAMATSTSEIMTVLLGAIASVSLVVGGIGIMNIMLVSVTERTREIGIRMAVGARKRDILHQFLIESITLSSIGGVLGILCGIATSKILSAISEWPSLVSLSSVLVAFLFSASVGVFFGYYPAHKASELDPIEALRYE